MFKLVGRLQMFLLKSSAGEEKVKAPVDVHRSPLLIKKEIEVQFAL